MGVVAAEGARGFFAGMSMTLLASLPSTAVYFGAYEALKKMVSGGSGRRLPWITATIAGGLLLPFLPCAVVTLLLPVALGRTNC